MSILEQLGEIAAEAKLEVSEVFQKLLEMSIQGCILHPVQLTLKFSPEIDFSKRFYAIEDYFKDNIGQEVDFKSFYAKLLTIYKQISWDTVLFPNSSKIVGKMFPLPPCPKKEESKSKPQRNVKRKREEYLGFPRDDFCYTIAKSERITLKDLTEVAFRINPFKYIEDTYVSKFQVHFVADEFHTVLIHIEFSCY